MLNIIYWIVYVGLMALLDHVHEYKPMFVYHIIVNVIAVILCAIDKNRAINHKSRISEKQLFLVSFMGGAVGMWFAMTAVRHKTKHLTFMLGIPLIAFVNAFIVYFLYTS